ncbi:unnamed protein product [Calypogeia fissa]
MIQETASESWNGAVVEPFLPSDKGALDKHKHPKPVAWLEGLYVQDGEMSPVFNPRTLNYSVTVSPGVTNIQIVVQVSLGTDHEKYKVKTKSRILKPSIVNSPLHGSGNASDTLVEVHVSAHDHQSVTYYLEVGHALQERSKVWSVLLQILFWAGVVVAVAVVGIFGYSIYLALSEGGVTGERLQGYISRGGDGDYEAVQDSERTGSSRS